MNIFVGNLDFKVNEHDLEDVFEFTWFTLDELEAYEEKVDPRGEFRWFYEIARAVSHLLDTESVRFIAAFY